MMNDDLNTQNIKDIYVGGESLADIIYKTIIPIINDKFNINPDKVPEFLISDEHSTSVYNRMDGNVYFHPEITTIDTIAEEYMHFLRDYAQLQLGNDLDTSEAVIEFYGMLARCVAYEELKNTKYATLFSESHNKSISDKNIQSIITLNDQLTDEEKNQISIVSNENPMTALMTGRNYFDMMTQIRNDEIENYHELHRILSDQNYISEDNIDDTIEKINLTAQYLEDKVKTLDEKIQITNNMIEGAQQKQLPVLDESKGQAGTLMFMAQKELYSGKQNELDQERKDKISKLEMHRSLLMKQKHADDSIREDLVIDPEVALKQMTELVSDFSNKPIEELKSEIDDFTEFKIDMTIVKQLEMLNNAYRTNNPEIIKEKHDGLLNVITGAIEPLLFIQELEEAPANLYREFVDNVKKPLSDMDSAKNMALSAGVNMPTKIDCLIASGIAHKTGYDAALEAYPSMTNADIEKIIFMSQDEINDKYIEKNKAAISIQSTIGSMEASICG